MKVRIRLHPGVCNELGIKGLPYWYKIPGVPQTDHSGYRKVVLVQDLKDLVLPPQTAEEYELVTEVIDEKENVASAFFTDLRCIVEEYEPLPKDEKKIIKGGK